MRIMGLDYGAKTVGVALTDPMGLIVQPLETIERTSENKLRRTLARIQELTAQYQVDSIVLGLPITMDGEIGERASKTLAFKEKLEQRLRLPVMLQDERLTTFAADEDLQVMQIPKKDRKKYIDQIAAVYILEDYLNQKTTKNEDYLNQKTTKNEDYLNQQTTKNNDKE